ncbi:anaerobic ribonucleoside-triphosphate reductase [Paenibacillus motobuensis]|uniref:anaerobic ribonucleoside-triphosphate reductase n=1 Tax=Paenibacillus TaxID=44249 RepID=UPI00203D9672|nr:MULTISPECIES: anaerobic ribonucleoside-triphosphate reductase [Paenibacillus]MCM3041735.1 anaerobic ribonucleoside-triphosphate reductase [Paenibacillus lutimineralis]MCM3648839.1 anaerobic ribonucleoside-triphosphate reductase [Paenibacillus motobuensis]
MLVIKRDGSEVAFNQQKIIDAICAAMNSTEKKVDLELAHNLADKVTRKISKLDKVDIEHIQDEVQSALMNSRRKDVAEAYIGYREVRTLKRRERSSLDRKVLGLLELTNEEVLKENSNKDGATIPTQRDLLAGIMAKDFAQTYMIPKRVVEAHNSGDLHFHDQDYSPYFPIYNCMLIDLKGMLENGFKLGNAQIETPKSITTATAITAQIIAQVASHIYGGNTINEIDKILAPYVLESFKKHYRRGLEWLYMLDESEISELDISWENEEMHEKYARCLDYAKRLTEKETFDAFQSLEYEINTLVSANGQTPFSTFGFGRGLSWAERQIQISILQNRIRGLGRDGKTAIFPKLIFAIEDGVNLKPSDPNYDIKQLALKCSTLRMYPDIISVPKVKEITGSFKFPMGCRSFLGEYEENGELLHDGRFNMGVVTANLPRIAIRAQGSEQKFYRLLDELLEACKEGLLYRIERLKGVKAKVAPILYMEGAAGSRLQAEDTIDHLLENGRASISLGYIGIHETMMALYGRSIFEDEVLRAKGLQIVKYLSRKTAEWKEETGYGFSLYSTPAESLCYRFCKLDEEKFGVIPGVTDKGYYTNSFHLDVNKKVTPFEKIEFEKEYPQHANGGFITYCEFDSLVHNPEALEAVWDYAYERVPYFGTNTPTDKCLECGYEGEFEATNSGFQCPNCGNSNPKTSSVIRRCCGYLSEPSQRPFNAGKQKEVLSRVKHM